MTTTAGTPPLKELIFSYLGPIIDFALVLDHGLRPTLQYMSSHPLSIFSLSTWRSQLIEATQPWLMDLVDQSWAPVKGEILKNANGRVLEIGAGTGETLKYYPLKQIDRIYGVEPSLSKCAILQQKSEELGMRGKYEVIPRGIEALDGIKSESIDTIVCVRSSMISKLRIFRFIVFAVFQILEILSKTFIISLNLADSLSSWNMLHQITGSHV